MTSPLPHNDLWQKEKKKAHHKAQALLRQIFSYVTGSPLRIILFLSFIILTIALIWYTTLSPEEKVNFEEVPIILGPAHKIKTRPTNPGGMLVPHQDKLVYNKISKEKPRLKKKKAEKVIEKIIEEPTEDFVEEKLASLEQFPPHEQSNILEHLTREDTSSSPTPLPLTAPQESEKAPEVEIPTIELTVPSPKPGLLASPETQTGVIKTHQTIQAPTIAAPQEAISSASPSSPLSRKAPAQQKKLEEAVSIAPILKKQGFMIQLGSLKTLQLAQREKEHLWRSWSHILGSEGTSIVRVDLGQRGIYYRIFAGPFSSKEEAEKKCSSIKKQKGNCLVTKLP